MKTVRDDHRAARQADPQRTAGAAACRRSRRVADCRSIHRRDAAWSPNASAAKPATAANSWRSSTRRPNASAPSPMPRAGRKSTSGALVLLYVIEPGDFQHWLGVEKIMREEAPRPPRRRSTRYASKVRADARHRAGAGGARGQADRGDPQADRGGPGHRHPGAGRRRRQGRAGTAGRLDRRQGGRLPDSRDGGAAEPVATRKSTASPEQTNCRGRRFRQRFA